MKIFNKQNFFLKSIKLGVSLLMQPINKEYKIEISSHNILLYQEK